MGTSLNETKPVCSINVSSFECLIGPLIYNHFACSPWCLTLMTDKFPFYDEKNIYSGTKFVFVPRLQSNYLIQSTRKPKNKGANNLYIEAEYLTKLRLICISSVSKLRPLVITIKLNINNNINK